MRPDDPALDGLASRLTARLAAWPRRTIRVDELMGELVSVSPELATASGRFARLAEAVDALARDKALGNLLRGPLSRPEVVEALAVKFVHPPMAV